MNCRGRVVGLWSRAITFKWRAHLGSGSLCSSLPQFCIFTHYFHSSWSPPLLGRLWFGHIWQIGWCGWCCVTGSLWQGRMSSMAEESTLLHHSELEESVIQQRTPLFTDQSCQKVWPSESPYIHLLCSSLTKTCTHFVPTLYNPLLLQCWTALSARVMTKDMHKNHPNLEYAGNKDLMATLWGVSLSLNAICDLKKTVKENCTFGCSHKCTWFSAFCVFLQCAILCQRKPPWPLTQAFRLLNTQKRHLLSLPQTHKKILSQLSSCGAHGKKSPYPKPQGLFPSGKPAPDKQYRYSPGVLRGVCSRCSAWASSKMSPFSACIFSFPLVSG